MQSCPREFSMFRFTSLQQSVFSLTVILSGAFLSFSEMALAQTKDNTSVSKLPSELIKDAKTAEAVTARLTERTNNNRTDENYRIGSGDLIDVRVFRQPELSQQARVNNQGFIRMPFIGDLQVVCLTESEIARMVADKYRKYLNDPQVDVFIREYQSQPVAVIGAVEKPAQFQLQRRVKLLELLTFAGGPKKEAGHIVHVIHTGSRSLCDVSGNTDSETAPVDALSFSSYKLNDLLTGSLATNVYINPGDVVSLPEAEQVFVTGMVVKPGSVKMPARITLTQAIAMAGGFTPEAGKKKVRLLRQQPGSAAVIEKVFNIEEIEKKKLEDVVLEASDVVDVPNSAGKSFLQSLVRQVAPTLSTLPIVLRY